MNLYRYYITASLFAASRMGIGATSVLYMLSCGLNLGSIASIKIVQALVIFFAEIPTGLVADSFGRKWSMVFASISAILSFSLYILWPNVWGFSFAEAFNALAISFWSGAFEALAVDNTRAANEKGNFIEYFFAKISKYTSIAVMISGLIGGYIGEIDLKYPFYFSIGLMLITLVYFSLVIREGKKIKNNNNEKILLKNRIEKVLLSIKNNTKSAFKFMLSSLEIRRFFLIQIAIQFALQPVFHYWQPYFKDIGSEVNSKTMGVIFFSYVFVQALFSWSVSTFYKKRKIQPSTISFLGLILSTICFLLLAFPYSLMTAILSFCLMQGGVGIFRNNIAASFNRCIPSEQRSTILSSVSFISRLGMFFHLAILWYTTEVLPIRYSFLFSFLAFVLIGVIFVNLTKLINNQKVKV